MPKPVKRALITLLVLGLAAGATFGIIAGVRAYNAGQERDRAEAVDEFRRDLVAAGFTDDATLQVGWKTEQGDSEEIDATTRVGNCPIELERDGTTALAEPVFSGGVEVVKFYKFDEVQIGDDPDGIDATQPGRDRQPFGRSHPTRAQVYDYLAQYRSSFPCFAPEQTG
ncbi:MAG TPA: hypothetical protein VJM32_04525 [Candidatus Saccharimonadales bacterium]|nr:hypothetical protein [Candidatus Saccharimonadales bacterium]